MKTLIRISLAFLSFSLEISVRAETLIALGNDPHPTKVPDHCIAWKSDVCSFSTGKNFKLHLKNGDFGSAVLGSGAQASAQSKNVLLLINGDVLVQGGKKGLVIKTLHAEATIKSGYALVRRQSDTYEFINYTAEVEVASRQFEKRSLAKGVQVSVGPISYAGHSLWSWPKTVNILTDLKTLAPLWNQDRESFAEFVFTTRQEQAAVVDGLASVYETRVERELAYAAESSRQAAQNRERLRRQEAELREIFRQKNYAP